MLSSNPLPVSPGIEDEKDEEITQELANLSAESLAGFLHYTPTPPPPPQILPSAKVLEKCLFENFQLQAFRPKQLEIIHAIMEGEDCFIRMATGAGKSLLWQIPALCQEVNVLLTVVVCPTTSLIMDQMKRLCKVKAPFFLPVCYYGDMPIYLKEITLWLLQRPHIGPHCLVLTPTQLTCNPIKSLLVDTCRSGKLVRLIIDEVDKAITWQSFYRGYQGFKELKEIFSKVQIIAMTGSITLSLMEDCIKKIGMQDCNRFYSSLDRPNLYYKVKQKHKHRNQQQLIKDIVDLKRDGPGIIYCTFTGETEHIAALLREQGIPTECYHGRLKEIEKNRVYGQWMRGEIEIVVATSAFGMGIDKHNVRWVVHETLPSSIEDWFQESGRAGRDGRHANCILYFQGDDYFKVSKLIAKDPKPKDIQSCLQPLRTLTNILIDKAHCWRQQLLNHFAEIYGKENCGACNFCCEQAWTNCWSEQNVTVDAQNAVALLRQMRELEPDWTASHLAQAIFGDKSAEKRFKMAGVPNLVGFGCGFSLTNGQNARTSQIREFIALLIIRGVLTEYKKDFQTYHHLYIKPKVSMEDIATMELHMNLPATSVAHGIDAGKDQGPKVVKELHPESGKPIDVIVID